MQAVQELRHRLGDPYISLGQVILLMADMVLEGEPQAEEEPEEVAHVCHDEDAGPMLHSAGLPESQAPRAASAHQRPSTART